MILAGGGAVRDSKPRCTKSITRGRTAGPGAVVLRIDRRGVARDIHGVATGAMSVMDPKPMLSDAVKYWLAVAAIMLAMWGYSGRISAALIFGLAGVGAFVYWRVSAARHKRHADAGEHRADAHADHEHRPHGV